jgi:CheY-like chemotaxis protein
MMELGRRRESLLMVVEDNEAHAELTVSALKSQNIANRIITMKDGQEALDYLRGNGKWAEETNILIPDLILLDLKMPNIGGKEFLMEIKHDGNLNSIPVIMLTSSGLESDIEECYALGANSYIVKPVSFAEFMKTVTSIPMYWLMVNRLPEVR